MYENITNALTLGAAALGDCSRHTQLSRDERQAVLQAQEILRWLAASSPAVLADLAVKSSVV